MEGTTNRGREVEKEVNKEILIGLSSMVISVEGSHLLVRSFKTSCMALASCLHSVQNQQHRQGCLRQDMASAHTCSRPWCHSISWEDPAPAKPFPWLHALILTSLCRVFLLSFAGQLQRMTGECCVACWGLLVPIGDDGMGSTLCSWAHTSFLRDANRACCLPSPMPLALLP